MACKDEGNYATSEWNVHLFNSNQVTQGAITEEEEVLKDQASLWGKLS